MRYNDVYTWVQDQLKAKGYGKSGGPRMPKIDPGPPTIQGLWKKSPKGMLFLTLGNGAGLAMEGLFDRTFLVVRVVGEQDNFAYAENLAYDMDDILLAVDHNTTIGTGLTLYVTRTAGPPQLIDYDASNRYHYQSTYLMENKR